MMAKVGQVALDYTNDANKASSAIHTETGCSSKKDKDGQMACAVAHDQAEKAHEQALRFAINPEERRFHKNMIGYHESMKEHHREKANE